MNHGYSPALVYCRQQTLITDKTAHALMVVVLKVRGALSCHILRLSLGGGLIISESVVNVSCGGDVLDVSGRWADCCRDSPPLSLLPQPALRSAMDRADGTHDCSALYACGKLSAASDSSVPTRTVGGCIEMIRTDRLYRTASSCNPCRRKGHLSDAGTGA